MTSQNLFQKVIKEDLSQGVTETEVHIKKENEGQGETEDLKISEEFFAPPIVDDNCSCQICGKILPNYKSLKFHVISHASSPFKCTECPKSFKTDKRLQEHINDHILKTKIFCPICKQVFSKKSTLMMHKVIHAKQTEFKCAVCGKKFGSRGNLKTHLSIHSKIKPFQCSICSKKFSQNANLKTHFETHMKCHFQCQCGSNFRNRGALADHHLRVHGIRVINCKFCNINFPNKDELNKHTRLKHSTLKCSVCGMSFDNDTNVFPPKCCNCSVPKIMSKTLVDLSSISVKVKVR